MKRRVHIKSTPTHIAMLIKSIGTDKAANALGITPSAIKKYVRAGKAPKASEIAAAALCGTNSNQEATLILRGAPDLLGVLRDIAVRGGGRATEL